MPPALSRLALASSAPLSPSTVAPRPMSPSLPSLDAAMARLAEGDRSAFAEVFTALQGPIERLCRSMLMSEADAADAAQEALCKILERASDYDKARAALPWALAIAAWECRTILRKRTRRRETELPSQEPGGAHAEEGLLQRDLVQAATSALGELSDVDRETLVATFWEEGVAVSGATLRKRRERALGRLRVAWRRLYGLD